MRTFVIGDIHGAHRALIQALDRAGFDYDNDQLICLGDVADGWPETRQCVDELLKISNLIYILGNHDFWTLEWLETGYAEDVWVDQGGKATQQSYGEKPQSHISFFKNAVPYHISNNRLFVHAGISPLRPIEEQTYHTFLWDRNLARTAFDLFEKGIPGKLTTYDEVYIGHTPIPFHYPIQSGDVWMMDTGAGWSGVLSIMDIRTKEYWTSDPVPSLYPGVEGRKRKF